MTDRAELNRNAHLDYFAKTEVQRGILEKQLTALKLLAASASPRASYNYLEYIKHLENEAWQGYAKATSVAAEEWSLDVGIDI